MFSKKRYKFQVELTLNELTEVTFGKAILFSKIRQLDGGGFSDFSQRLEVSNHNVKYFEKFTFPCKMNANSSTGVLESCKCRISIRKEEKGGKNFRKIGFVDVDLAEYAGAGPSTQRYILQAYDQSHRLDNSMLNLTLNITLKEGDPVFQRLITRQQPIQLPGEEDHTAPNSLSVNSRAKLSMSDVIPGEENSHSRNSSSTSQPGNSIGNSSNSSQPALSRHSSDESLHYDNNLNPGHNSSGKRLSSSGSGSGTGGGTGIRGSTGGGGADGGWTASLEKENRRRRIDSGRVDPEKVIDELMEELELDSSTALQLEPSQGLQLYLGPEGTFTFDQPRLSNTQFKPVVIDKS